MSESFSTENLRRLLAKTKKIHAFRNCVPSKHDFIGQLTIFTSAAVARKSLFLPAGKASPQRFNRPEKLHLFSRPVIVPFFQIPVNLRALENATQKGGRFNLQFDVADWRFSPRLNLDGDVE